MNNATLKKMILAANYKLGSKPDSRSRIPRYKDALVHVNDYGVKLTFRPEADRELINHHYQIVKNIQLDAGLADRTKLHIVGNNDQIQL